MKKVGIFGGTFNPIHNGHLNLMDGVKKALSLDEIWLMPAFTPPHKEAEQLASGEDRIAMLELVCKDREGFSVCRYEVDKGGKSYTVETAEYLSAAYPADEFYFLMGTDMLLTFDEWYRYEDILKYFILVAAARNEGEYAALHQKAKELPGRVEIVRLEPLPASSTDVRELLRNGEDVSHLLPPEVLSYLQLHKLYG